MRNILMPVRTVAEWGGVHEWTVDAARALMAAGHDVTFIGAGAVFQERAEATGAHFLTVNWDAWEEDVPTLLDDARVRGADMIFAHAPHARMLGLELSRQLHVELYVMIHGAYHDYMYAWSQHVTGFLAASPSLVHFSQRFGRVEPWKVSLVPNAAADHIFETPLKSFVDKTQDGVARIVTAARLAKDKLPQIQAVLEAVRTSARLHPDLHWQIDVYGDGPLRSSFEAQYTHGIRDISNASLELHGWITPEAVPTKMSEAVLGVVAGMGGVRTIAAGALCVGVGARGSVGLQDGQNLRAGIWSNFGDHGTMKFAPSDLATDLERTLDPGTYDATVAAARTVLHRTNSQSIVDGMMLSALHC